MQIVIDIPEDVYGKLLEEQQLPNRINLEYYISHGTPLPKGHGRLIDVDAITKDFNTFQDSFVINMDGRGFKGIACIAPTIIEADKEDQ